MIASSWGRRWERKRKMTSETKEKEEVDEKRKENKGPTLRGKVLHLVRDNSKGGTSGRNSNSERYHCTLVFLVILST